MSILQPRSVLKSKKLEFDGFLEENEMSEADDSSHSINTDNLTIQTNVSITAFIGTFYLPVISFNSSLQLCIYE